MAFSQPAAELELKSLKFQLQVLAIINIATVSMIEAYL
jgi:hypothetical protein